MTAAKVTSTWKIASSVIILGKLFTVCVKCCGCKEYKEEVVLLPLSQYKSCAIAVSRSTGRVLLMKRGATAKFMPNALVFPGGVHHESDEKLGDPTKSSALREVFEETGLLISDSGVESAADCEHLAKTQNDVRADPSLFSEICSRPGFSSLIEWNRWLTPSTHPRRFMTSFFVLPVEGEPSIRMCEKEMAGHEWSDPAECLKDAFKGVVALPPPQVYELNRIQQTAIEDLAKAGNTRAIICPQPVMWQDRSRISNVLPGDHLYIEEDAFQQPGRTLSPQDGAVKSHLPTHRAEYSVKPLWAQCRVYQHKLKDQHAKLFRSFNSNSIT